MIVQLWPIPRNKAISSSLCMCVRADDGAMTDWYCDSSVCVCHGFYPSSILAARIDSVDEWTCKYYYGQFDEWTCDLKKILNAMV